MLLSITYTHLWGPPKASHGLRELTSDLSKKALELDIQDLRTFDLHYVRNPPSWGFSDEIYWRTGAETVCYRIVRCRWAC